MSKFYSEENLMFRSLHFSLRLILILSSICLAASVSFAQTGTPPFGSFTGGPDVINLANLNAHWTFPILHKPGRGTDFAYDLSYDSLVWYPVTSGSTTTWQPVNNWGWKGVTDTMLGYVTHTSTTIQCPSGVQGHFITSHLQSNFVYTDQFGIQHAFANQVGTCDGAGDLDPTTATDGSGLTLIVPNRIITSSGQIITAAGQVGYSSGTNTDRNGNQISITSSGVFTDTLGTTALTVSGGAPNPLVLAYTNSAGTSASYQVKYSTYTVQTNFGCTGIAEYGSNGTTTASLVSEIDLPDGVSKYTFAYEPTPGAAGKVTGRLAWVILPTGGKIRYDYSGGSSGNITCSDSSPATLTRTTPDGIWTYAHVKGTGAASTTTVTAPQEPYDSSANQTIIQFQGIYETQRQVYRGSSTSGTLFQTINTCYNTSTAPCTGTAVALPITQKTVTASIPGSGNFQSQHTDKYDSYGQLTESDDYDFATAAPFPLLKQTLITYASLGSNLHAFKQTVMVKDGSGVIKSRQDTIYDGYASFTGANCVTGAAQHDDTGYGCTFTSRANATAVTNYTDPVTPSGAITKSFSFDSLGNLRTAQDNCCQKQTWAYSVATQYAYPDSVTNGASSPQLTTSSTYDLNMGLTLTTTDPNNVKTTFTYDSMGRLLSQQVGSNPASTTSYSDFDNSTTMTPWTATVCSPIQGTSVSCEKSIFDSQGRVSTAQFLDGSSTLYSASDTQYDSLGRPYKTSNPYTSSVAYWTETDFDALGRVTKTTLPDNSPNTFAYSDNVLTTSDPSGKQRKLVSDSLGRLTGVYEPDPANGNALTILTSYTYNVFDELTQVTEGGQTRSYSFDALGRPLAATTPEAGSVCFGTLSGATCQPNGYDSFSNLLSRTDSRGVVTNYIYDSLNRLVGISYPTVPSGVAAMPNVCKANGAATNNANVCYNYGTSSASFNNGRLVSMVDPTGSESYAYDQYGNVTSVAKVVGTVTYNTSYAYNLDNQLTQITYPSSRIIQQNVDTIGRLTSVIGTLSTVNTTYASGYSYDAAQDLTGFKYGNNLYAAFGYSADRLQLNCLDYSTTNRSGTCVHDGTTKFGLGYAYGTAGSNNGQISAITDSVDSGRNESYTYDALYRLTGASTTGSTGYPKWGLAWTYDRFGNRITQSIASGCSAITCPTNSLTVSASTNRITTAGYSYDASGNMTNDAANVLTYDGEDHIATSSNGTNSGAYAYDGNGTRIMKCVPNCTSPTTSIVYIFSGSKVIAEYQNGAAVASPTREYVYSGGTLLAKIDSTGTNYYHQDQLSNRLITNSSGTVSAQLGHFPFGESWYNASNDKLLFSSYERDSESGNDYAMARYQVNRLGRFSSPDVRGGSLNDPQSINRYAYALNDPCNLSDPFGLSPCTLKIGLNGQTLLPNTRQTIENIYKDAGIDVTFVDGGSGTVDVFQYKFLGYLGLGTLGFNPPGSNYALTDNNVIGSMANAVHGSYELALGVVISHEIGHALGQPHGREGIMRQGNDHGNDAFFMNMGGAQNFTRAEAASMRQKLGCQNKPKKKPNPPAKGGKGVGSSYGGGNSGRSPNCGPGLGTIIIICDNGYICGLTGCGCAGGPWIGGPCQSDGGSGSGCHGDIFEPCDAMNSAPGEPIQILVSRESPEKLSRWRGWPDLKSSQQPRIESFLSERTDLRSLPMRARRRNTRFDPATRV